MLLYIFVISIVIVIRFGDIRSQMCKYIVEMWHRLAEKRGHFIPNMIGPFLKISLLKEKGIIIILSLCCLSLMAVVV